jgi:hypothetical protein
MLLDALESRSSEQTEHSRTRWNPSLGRQAHALMLSRLVHLNRVWSNQHYWQLNKSVLFSLGINKAACNWTPSSSTKRTPPRTACHQRFSIQNPAAQTKFSVERGQTNSVVRTPNSLWKSTDKISGTAGQGTQVSGEGRRTLGKPDKNPETCWRKQTASQNSSLASQLICS